MVGQDNQPTKLVSLLAWSSQPIDQGWLAFWLGPVNWGCSWGRDWESFHVPIPPPQLILHPCKIFHGILWDSLREIYRDWVSYGDFYSVYIYLKKKRCMAENGNREACGERGRWMHSPKKIPHPYPVGNLNDRVGNLNDCLGGPQSLLKNKHP